MSGYSSTSGMNEYFAPSGGVPGMAQVAPARKRKRSQTEIAIDTAVGLGLGIGAVYGGKRLINFARFRKGKAIIGLHNQFRDLETLVTGRQKITKVVKNIHGQKVSTVLKKTAPITKEQKAELLRTTESLITRYLPEDVIANNRNNPLKLRKMVLDILKNPDKQVLQGYQKWVKSNARPYQAITPTDLKVGRRLYVEALKSLRDKSTAGYVKTIVKNPNIAGLQKEPDVYFSVKEIQDEIGRLSKQPRTLQNPFLRNAGYDPNKIHYYQQIVEYLQTPNTQRGGGISTFKMLQLPGSTKVAPVSTDESHLTRVMGEGWGGRVAQIRERQRAARPPLTDKLPKYLKNLGEKWEKRYKKSGKE